MDRQTLNNVRILAAWEMFRDEYCGRRDPIQEDRLLSRAQSFRHLTHLLPGQSILELGAGSGLFVSHLIRVSRGENPITAVRFGPRSAPPFHAERLTWVDAEDLPGILGGL
jgi:hypothetical protein